MKRLFVFEYLTGGGAIEGDPAAGDDLLPSGLAMRDAIVADLLRSGAFTVSVATCDRAPMVPGPAFKLRAHAGESPLAFVARQAARHDLSWIVAPESGGLLAQFQRAVGAPRWLGCEAGAIAIASSKRATLLRLAEHGLATPLAFENAPEATRWVVKPDDGAGTVDTRVHTQRAAALDDQRLRSRPGAATVIEPWIDGDPLSISLMCTRRGAELLSINRQRIHVDAPGRVSYGGVQVNVETLGSTSRRAPLQHLADAVTAAIPGLRGFVGIDLVWHAQRGPVVIEVNPRVTCAYVGLSASLSRNLAAELVAAHGVEAQPAHA